MADVINVNAKGIGNVKVLLEKDAIKVKDILINIENIMKKIDGNNDVWVSKSSIAAYEYFLNISKKFPDINNKLLEYSQALQGTIDSYEANEQQINTYIENNDDKLTVA